MTQKIIFLLKNIVSNGICSIIQDEDMYRGCITDSKDSRLLCQLGMGRCGICSEDGCNDQPLFIEPELSCYKCENSTDCGYGQIGAEKIVNCTMPVKVS